MIEIIARGVQLNSALYLSACVLAGLFKGNPFAWRLAIAAMGVTYLAYLAQIEPTRRWCVALTTWLSIALGLFAGLALLVSW